MDDNHHDPTIFAKNANGDWIHSHDQPYYLPSDPLSYLTYGEMRALATGIGKIFVHALKRAKLRAEVRARLAKGK